MLLVEAIEPVEEVFNQWEPGDKFHITYCEANEMLESGKVKIVCPIYLAYTEAQKEQFQDFLNACEKRY